MAIYVYGIMRAPDARDAVAGARGPEVGVVEHADLGALTSVLPDGELRLRRESIMGHADVVQAAFERGPVLPLRFGTALPSRDAVVTQLLASQADVLAARLAALEDRAEMQVKAIYSEEPLLRSILAQDRQLAALVQRTRQLPAAATHFERIRIGEAIAGALAARRARDEDGVMQVLRPLSVAVSGSPPHHARALVNAAFLIDRSRLPEFDHAVEAVSERYGADVEFKLIGPLPPYSFADRDWLGVGDEERKPAWA